MTGEAVCCGTAGYRPTVGLRTSQGERIAQKNQDDCVALEQLGSLCGQYGRKSREGTLVELDRAIDDVSASARSPVGTPAFEFLRWISFLKPDEQEILRLKFIEDWEYHEIAANKAIPVGTVQWRVFNAKRKLVPLLRRFNGAPSRTR